MKTHSFRRLAVLALLMAATVVANAQPTPAANRQLGESNAAPTRMESSRNVNGVRLHYAITGAGPVVVLIHGFPATMAEWDPVIPELAKRFTVLTVDLRGFGDSEKPRTGYDPFTMSADVHALTESLGYRDVYVVGHDIGSPIAYAFAAQFPTSVKKLALLEFVIAGAGLDQLLAATGFHLWHFAFQSVPDLPEALVAGRERLYLNAFLRPYAVDPSSISDAEIDTYVRAFSQPGAARAAFDVYRSLPETEAKVKAQLATRGKIATPTLVMAGDHSMATPGFGDPAKHAAEIVASNVTYVVVKDAGHWLPEEKPAFVTEQIIKFFQADAGR